MSLGGGTATAAAAGAAPHCLERATFGLAGRVLSVDVDDADAAHMLAAAYLPAFGAKPRAVHHTAALRRLGDGRLSVRFDRRAVTVAESAHGIPLLSAYYAAKEIFARFAAARPASAAFYGALVSVDGGGVLILGPATIGKTVLALHLALQGAKFLGDETAVLDFRSGTVCALARKPTLREGALPLLGDAALRDAIHASPHVIRTELGRFWYAVDAAEHGIEPCSHAYRLRAVCLLTRRAERCAIRRLDPAQALPAVMQRAYVRPAELSAVSALRRAMRHTAQYEMVLGDAHESAAALLAEVRGCE